MSRKKVAVITGGGTGIGAATAEELSAFGTNVVVVGRRPETLHDVVSRINNGENHAIAHPADITDYEAMESLSKGVVEQFGTIDLLVANAAVHDASSIDAGDPKKWREVVEVNVIGLMNTVRAFLPQMYEQGYGHIVVVSSLSGRSTYVGEPVYVASKHAQIAFAECLRKEVTPRGIKITVIEPGLVETPFIDNPMGKELKKSVCPLDSVDVARAIRFVFEQPDNCAINEIAMRPLKQIL